MAALLKQFEDTGVMPAEWNTKQMRSYIKGRYGTGKGKHEHS